MYTGSAHQLWEQFRAAIFVIFWSALVTFILMKLIGLVLGGARYKDEILEVGDLAIHGEEAFPEETFATRSDGAFALAGIGEAAPTSDRVGNIATTRCRVLGPPGRKELKNEADCGSPQAVQAR
jgi:hypothetical protein